MYAYDAIAQAWWRRRAGSAPFPLDERGWPACTSEVLALAWRVAAAAGIAAEDVGAKSFRFRAGGATDWRDCLGEASERVVRQRGRW